MEEGKVTYYTGDVQVLSSLESVRKRPGMYIGNTDDGSGLHHLVYEVVDNSIDEALAGHCDTITVIIEDDMTVSVEDNGRGMPVEVHPGTGVSAAEMILTVLHAGGKFDQNSYKVSGGLHSVGVSVVNFLSKKLTIDVRREGKLWRQHYTQGVPDGALEAVGDVGARTGTKLTIQADEAIFPDQRFDFEVLSRRLRELSYLKSGVSIRLVDERAVDQETFYYEEGLKGRVKEMASNRRPVHEEPFVLDVQVSEEVQVAVSLQWTQDREEEVLCYTNTVHNREGGTHLDGLRAALVHALNACATRHQLTTKRLGEQDACRGLVGVLSVRVVRLAYAGSTRDKLVSDYIKEDVKWALASPLEQFFEAHLPLLGRLVEGASMREQGL